MATENDESLLYVRGSMLRKQSTMTIQDIWVPFMPNSPPVCAGVYGFYCEALGGWFFLGYAKNIAKRIGYPKHPFSITRSLNHSFSYWFIQQERNYSKLGMRLIAQLKPIGNGGDSILVSHQWYHPRHRQLPAIRNRVTPHGKVCQYNDAVEQNTDVERCCRQLDTNDNQVKSRADDRL